MPSISLSQRRLFNMALAYKRGALPHASDEVKSLADSMSEETIHHFSDTPTKGLPERVKESSQVPTTGPEAIAYALQKLDTDKLSAEAKDVITSKKVSKRPKAVQVLNALEGLKRNNLTPGDLLVNSVPVIPPAFRPFSV